MKFPVILPDYKLISPFPNMPDQLKEKFKELGNKISPLPLLMSESQVFDGNENVKHVDERNIEVKPVLTLDDIEHGIFKRKRRT